MTQNRNKLINLFIGNISNAVVHKILEEAIGVEEIKNKYYKEIKTSFDIAKYYRDKINPINQSLPKRDILEIKRRITNNVQNELILRISKGYKNISLNLVEGIVDEFLKKTRVSE